MEGEDLDCYPAPYGRSCTNCSQSKCKCMYPRSGGRCRRCQRLNKECHQPSSYKRKTAQKLGASRAARLEEKLDDLVSLLRAGVHPSGAESLNALLGQVSQSRDATGDNVLTTPDSLEIVGGSSGGSTASSLAVELTPATNASDATSRTSSAELTPLQAEENLTFFQTNFLPFFPCLYIPSGTSAEQLNQERPFTWLCIMAVASRHAGQRRILTEKLKSTVTQKMIFDHENTDIDILHGLLIYVAWSNQQIDVKMNLNVYSQLIHAAVYELRIHNPLAKSRMMPLCVYSEGHEEERVPGETMEERRTILAAFLVTSIISTYLKKIDGLHWTLFMEQCLNELEETPECLNDEILAHLVRLQLSIAGIGGNQPEGPSATSDSIYTGSSFTRLYLLQDRLENFKPRLVSDSLGYNALLLHHHYATLLLHESALISDPTVDNRPLTIEQLKHHYACLEASRSWFEVFFNIPTPQFIGLPFSNFAQMVTNLVILYQLSTFENDLWNIPTVRDTADVLDILENLIQKMGQVPSAVGWVGEPGSDVFSVIAKLYRSVQLGWEIKLGPDLLSDHSADQMQTL